MKMKNIILFCLISLLFFGCFETKEKYIINPDGSGKVQIESAFQKMDISMGNQQEDNTDVQMKKAVKSIIEKSKGVDTWKNITYKMNNEGKIVFKGTAYFKNISKLKIHDISMLKAVMKKGEKGTLILELKDEDAEKKRKKKKKKLSPSEMKKEIKKQKAGYQQMKPMLSAFLSTMKMESTYVLPGKIKSSINFKKINKNTLNVVFKGDKLVKVLDEFTSDDKWWEKQVSAGKNINKDSSVFNEEINKKLFGEKGPIRAVALKGKPQFNYKREVKKAKKQFAKIIKKLEIKKKEKNIPLAKGGKFKSLKVGGVKIVRISDWKNNIRAFHSDKGYTLSLVGELPGSVLKITEGRLLKAITDRGDNLAPKDEWKSKIRFITLSKDKNFVNFDLEMDLPSKKVKRFKKIQGEIYYISAKKMKKVDVGLSSFNEGAKGKKYNVVIKSVKESQWQKGHFNIAFEIDLLPDAVKSVFFYKDDGLKLNAYELSRNPKGDKKTELTYSFQGELPSNGKLEIEVYEGMQKYKIPFSLKNIKLLGH